MGVPFFSMSSMLSEVKLSAPIQRVLASGYFILGPEVSRFEDEFADYCGTAHCVGVANGTDALELALRALEIGSGMKVAVVANAGPYGSTAVLATGAIPRYVDVDEKTLNLDPASLEEALDEGVRAVIVTHLYGQLADVEAILRMADVANVPVVEDCAQAHGAHKDGVRAGSMGVAGCFSFYPTKNLGAIGDGGAVVTDDDAVADRIRQLREYGWERKYIIKRGGGRNSRLDELQAAVLSARLPYLDEWNHRRRDVASHYLAAFSDLPIRPVSQGGESDVSHLFVVRADDRDVLADQLRESGVGTAIHYPVPDHLQAGHRKHGSLPETEAACASVLSLPCYPGLTVEDQDRVVAAVRKHYATARA